MYIYMCVYILYVHDIYIYIYILYIYMLFTTEGLFEGSIKIWPEWDLNP